MMVSSGILASQRPSSFVNRLWRGGVTGFAFILFGAGGLLLSTLWFILLLIREPVRRSRVARASIGFCFRFFLWLLRQFGAMDYRIDGLDKLRQDKGCLIVANHPSLIDYVLLTSVMPQCGCLVKNELLANPFVSRVIKAANYLTNSQSDVLLPECRQRLTAGENILIFPEGTRTQPGQPLRLQRGAANIAVRCRSEIRLVHIFCSHPLLTKQSKWYHVPPTKPYFTIAIGEKVSADAFFADGDASPALAARRLNRHLTLALTPDNVQPPEIEKWNL